ncbi:flagellar hook-length control protein FliK [Ponticaulis sp.]|uniref:flagellar hook-length control protein FliK n=1 Tax=Ponticaulis sp. TaxID=2020902 RepID=UPI000B6378B5|nr:flagellar hook-length control protein FliK [Ponticaulis sp.]MAI89788.1 hypothetical protein [Ponticaulis sp.]OUX99466.1 MAG: hypothetical protein CBB65_05055 [Hyphomonadaceae bacterium TMED5]|tara:strand:+ start:21350 stop:23272 length:1923 start_codon:yes stop_codon:yes gene_type:complete
MFVLPLGSLEAQNFTVDSTGGSADLTGDFAAFLKAETSGTLQAKSSVSGRALSAASTQADTMQAAGGGAETEWTGEFAKSTDAKGLYIESSDLAQTRPANEQVAQIEPGEIADNSAELSDGEVEASHLIQTRAHGWKTWNATEDTPEIQQFIEIPENGAQIIATTKTDAPSDSDLAQPVSGEATTASVALDAETDLDQDAVTSDRPAKTPMEADPAAIVVPVEVRAQSNVATPWTPEVSLQTVGGSELSANASTKAPIEPQIPAAPQTPPAASAAGQTDSEGADIAQLKQSAAPAAVDPKANTDQSKVGTTSQMSDTAKAASAPVQTTTAQPVPIATQTVSTKSAATIFQFVGGETPQEGAALSSAPFAAAQSNAMRGEITGNALNVKSGRGSASQETKVSAASGESSAVSAQASATGDASASTKTGANLQVSSAVSDTQTMSQQSLADPAETAELMGETSDSLADQDMMLSELQRNPSARTDSTQAVLARASTPATTAAVVSQVSQRLLERFDGGTSKFEIRLDPAELGEVDVKIEVDRDGRVQAVLTARESSAADALTRGLRSLENALTQAGLNLGENGVQIELDQRNDKEAFTHNGDASDNTDAQDSLSDTEQDLAEAETAPPRIQAWSRQRLDVTA